MVRASTTIPMKSCTPSEEVTMLLKLLHYKISAEDQVE